MKYLILALALLAGAAQAQERACGLAATDAVMTTVAVGTDIAGEANLLINSPLALLTSVAVRCAAAEYISTLPEPQRTAGLHTIEAVTLGIVANNAVQLLAGMSGVYIGPLGLVFGAVMGYRDWLAGAEEREFALQCAQFLAQGPGRSCEYTKH